MFDWTSFLDQRSVEYVTAGKNVSRGSIAIKCIFCSDDPSEHLNIKLHAEGNGFFRCYRCHKRGGDAFLLSQLLQCSIEDARQMTAGGQVLPTNISTVLLNMLQPEQRQESEHVLDLPSVFRKFGEHVSCRPYRLYMAARGYKVSPADRYTTRYGLRYCAVGTFAGRVIFPVYYKDRLISWAGRSIFASAKQRYLALTPDEDRAAEQDLTPAVAPVSHYLLWYNRLMKSDAHTLVLTEGPFDALKIEYLARKHGVRATCFFTSAPTQQQIAHLYDLVPRFKRTVLLLDDEALSMGMNTMDRLGPLGIEYRQMPRGIKDPGDINDLQTLMRILA